MDITILDSKQAMGQAAADRVEEKLRAAIEARGKATMILATGTSQFEMLQALTQMDIDFSSVTVFHLDEYIGLDASHPASFRKYLNDRFVSKVGPLEAFHGIDGTAADPQAECERLGELISQHSVDVACVGIGENGHLAFNDPPADFTTTEPYIVVDLDEVCRRQQLGEGWFQTLADVPTQAISMSCREIMQARSIVCLAPEARKAAPVKGAIEGPVDPACPASILQKHSDCLMLLDHASAAGLKQHGLP